MIKPLPILFSGICLIFFLSFFFILEEKILPKVRAAESIEVLQNKIQSGNNDIKKLEEEIARYEKELSTTKKDATTLKAAITKLNTTKKKLEADLKVTQSRINVLKLNIDKLGQTINEKTQSIYSGKESLAEAIRSMNESESLPLISNILTYSSLGEVWKEIDRLETLQNNVRSKIISLEKDKKALGEAKVEAEESQQKLKVTKSTLSDQETLVTQNQQEKNKLLVITKNKQSSYEQLLADRKEKKRLFEEDVQRAEAALKEALNPRDLPTYGAGVLAWPLDRIIITQYFGDTPFSRANPQVYAGKGHNGIDLGASEGTLVKAARGGTITGTGNTDTACPNASYGRWILLKHDNGLSTIYAHLSLIKATVGQSVALGEVIGYVGSSGYATGPHLHFTVYASEGVAIQTLASRACKGKNFIVPLPTKTGAVLNPMLYLPDES
jgi:murein DD-endopeptidase MepM/ murein hydrolase activator NlpD